MTDREKIESLFALARKKGELDADFFGGKLHLEDSSGEQSDDEESSSVSFDAQVEGLKIAQLFSFLAHDGEEPGDCIADQALDFLDLDDNAPGDCFSDDLFNILKFDGVMSGDCNADIAFELDQGDSLSLSGGAEVTCEKMFIPAIDLGIVLLPPNEWVTFDFVFSAEGGKVIIKRLSLPGSAYSIMGELVITQSEKHEKDTIEALFVFDLNKPVIYTEKGTAAKGVQYLLDALAASGAKLHLTLSGPLAGPKAELTADTPVGAIAWEL